MGVGEKPPLTGGGALDYDSNHPSSRVIVVIKWYNSELWFRNNGFDSHLLPGTPCGGPGCGGVG